MRGDSGQVVRHVLGDGRRGVARFRPLHDRIHGVRSSLFRGLHPVCARRRGGSIETAGAGGGPQEAASFDEFRRRYEELFDHPLPAVWYDAESVAPSSRVINDKAGQLTVVVDDHTLHPIDDTGDTVLSVNEFATAAVDFSARTHDFYVRELPGGFTAEEKVGLI